MSYYAKILWLSTPVFNWVEGKRKKTNIFKYSDTIRPSSVSMQLWNLLITTFSATMSETVHLNWISAEKKVDITYQGTEKHLLYLSSQCISSNWAAWLDATIVGVGCMKSCK